MQIPGGNPHKAVATPARSSPRDIVAAPAPAPRWLRAIVCIWLIAACTGMLALVRYAGAPGEAPRFVASWPESAPIPRDTSANTLLVFLHPRCPCSAATIAQLDRILTASPNPPRTIALLGLPATTEDPAWEHTALTDAVNRIPSVEILHDPNGAIASHFGATTSGYCMLFNQSGATTFAGGITPARAHEGDNPGAHALASAIADIALPITDTAFPTFGCPLILPDSAPDLAIAECCGGAE